VRIEVEDDGPGIEEHHRERIFERFYRIDAGRSRDVGGTGLGLSIVKHLVTALDGKLGIEPVTPHGARFWFTLPLAR
jgi:two-component system phosphate regulon sensor histidine kinase PhoR